MHCIALHLSQVARDQTVKDWKFMEAIDVDSYGSGYPSGRWKLSLLLSLIVYASKLHAISLINIRECKSTRRAESVLQIGLPYLGRNNSNTVKWEL